MFDEVTITQWIMFAVTAFLVGIAKTGIPGVGIVAVPLIAIASKDAKASVGLLLPLLIFADLFAAGYYRRKAQWHHIIRLIPWALAGIVAGYLTMKHLESRQLEPIIGLIVLVMVGLKYWHSSRKKAAQLEEINIPFHWYFAAALGFIAGMTTMMANAAGPVMVIYLLVMGLPKTQFVGTAAWFFFIVNWIKVPFMADLDLINKQSLTLNATLFPVIAVGAITGIFVLKRIPQKLFDNAVLILAAAAAIKLILS